MNTNNLIQVHTLTDNSSGYFFKSFDDEKSFVITSKHSICDQKKAVTYTREKWIDVAEPVLKNLI